MQRPPRSGFAYLFHFLGRNTAWDHVLPFHFLRIFPLTLRRICGSESIQQVGRCWNILNEECVSLSSCVHGCVAAAARWVFLCGFDRLRLLSVPREYFIPIFLQYLWRVYTAASRNTRPSDWFFYFLWQTGVIRLNSSPSSLYLRSFSVCFIIATKAVVPFVRPASSIRRNWMLSRGSCFPECLLESRAIHRCILFAE